MGAIITQIGLEKIANATVNEPLRLEKFAVGDGNGKKIIPNNEMKSLTNEKYRDLISSKYTNGNNTVFESVIKATAQIDEGFYIRELGLFDEVGDLIVIADIPAQYRPATNADNFITELLFNITIQVHDSSVIEIKINEQVFATVDSLNREISDRIEENKITQEKLQVIIDKNNINKWEKTYTKIETKSGVQTYTANLEPNKVNHIWIKFKENTNTNRLWIEFKIKSRESCLLDLWMDKELFSNVNGNYQARISCSNELGEIWSNAFFSYESIAIDSLNAFSGATEGHIVKRKIPKLFNEISKDNDILFNRRFQIFEWDNC